MKCPHCEYIDIIENEWLAEGEEEGIAGKFFEAEDIFKRDGYSQSLYGCPACNKTFME